MGAIFWYPLVSTTFVNFVAWSQERGYHVYGTSSHASQDFQAVGVYKFPLILLMGSERQGLTADQSAVCEVILRMPMKGRVTSLNLAVATGVMLYKMVSDLHSEI